MMPYFILGVDLNADDEAIRQAYLAAVREFPPDVDPARFQEISSAYAEIKHEHARLHHRLQRRDVPGGTPLGTLPFYFRFKKNPSPLPRAQLMQLLREGSKHANRH